MNIPPFVLASASPARRRLLQTIGIEAIVRPSNFDESQVQLSDPAQARANFGEKQSSNCSSPVSIRSHYGL